MSFQLTELNGKPVAYTIADGHLVINTPTTEFAAFAIPQDVRDIKPDAGLGLLLIWHYVDVIEHL